MGILAAKPQIVDEARCVIIFARAERWKVVGGELKRLVGKV